GDGARAGGSSNTGFGNNGFGPRSSGSRSSAGAVPPEVMKRWHTDENVISPADLRAHEAPAFTTGRIPVDPPPRRFCE
ncbi:unnamed protein product, partial [Ectocarpus sp. 12 AP-2014]